MIITLMRTKTQKLVLLNVVTHLRNHLRKKFGFNNPI